MIVALVVQRVQAVAAVELEINLEIEMWIFVLAIDPAALLDDLCDLAPALLNRP